MNKETEKSINLEKLSLDGSDRLSDLPDSILIEILSKLKAKQLIQTCVLSKRWLKLWTFVTCLDFTDFNFKTHKENPQNETENQVEILSFQIAVSSVLLRRDSSTDLHTFKLCHKSSDTETKISSTIVRSWLVYASRHNPKTLDLVLHPNELVWLPNRFFSCESLESLRIDFQIKRGGIMEEIQPNKVRLPRLKYLHLGYIHILEEYMETLLDGCPSLQNLTFINCVVLSEISPYIGVISAPRLKTIRFEVGLGSGLKLENVGSVTDAEIVSMYDEFDGQKMKYVNELLRGLYGVESLKLDGNVFKDTMEGELPNCPTFLKLKKLTLGTSCMYCNFGLVSSFLKHCPNLEVLTLLHCHKNREGGHVQDETSEDLLQVERFECNWLKKIEILYSSYRHVDKLKRLLWRSMLGIKDLQIRTVLI